MTRDMLDDLLDSSAPNFNAVDKDDIDAMIADASRLAPRNRPRIVRPRVVIAAGLAAVFASGGIGVAVATDGFSWAPWAQEPLGAVQFTMANGFECELRFSEYTEGSDPAYVEKVNGILEDWYRSTDVLAAARAIVPTKLEELGPIELQPGETFETLPPVEAEHREWVRQWSAWDLAISDAEWQELTSQGIQPGDMRLEGSERRGQIQCLDGNRELYAPGAGS